MDFPELAAFAEESTAIDATLASVAPEAWAGPGLGEWNLAQLVTHLIRGASRVTHYLPAPVEGPAGYDRVEYYRFDLEAAAPAVAQRAIEESSGVDPATLPQRYSAAWHADVSAAGEAGPAHVLDTIRGPMRLDEYLATRVVELVVHHMDVRIALEQPPVATPAAARMTMDILEGLLGEPRPRNLGRTRFILAATGRTQTEDERFPVLR